MKLTEQNIKKAEQVTRLRLALTRIQMDLKVVEDNDIFGDMIENFKDGDGELITEKLLQLVKEEERKLNDE